MTTVKKIVGGTARIGLGMVGAAGLGYITRIMLAKHLTIEEYGLFYAVFTFFAFFFFLSDMGLATAFIKHLAEFNVKKEWGKAKSAFCFFALFQFCAALVLIGVIYFFSDYLATSYFKNPAAQTAIYFFFAYTLFRVFMVLSRAVLIGLQKVKIYSLLEPLRNAVIVFALFFLFSAGYTILAPLIAFPLAFLAAGIFLFPFAYRAFPFFSYEIKNFSPTAKKMFLFGLPVMFLSAGGKVIGYLDTLILTQVSSLHQVGIYNVVLPSALLLLFVAESLTVLIFPMISESWARKEVEKVSGGLYLFYRLFFLVMMPLVMSMFYYADVFLGLFFGAEYLPGALPFQILLIGVLFLGIAKINNTCITAIGRPGVVTKIFLSGGLINLILNLVLIPLFGIMGAAAATTVCYIYIMIFGQTVIRKYVHTKFPLHSLLITFGTGLVFLLVLFGVSHVLVINKWLEICISVAIASISYVVLILSLKLTSFKEIINLASQLKI